MNATDPVVALTDGAVRGLAHPDHHTFRGIPYAAAPVGELRWRAPEPAEPWRGVRDATRHAPAAPQSARTFAEPAALDEDCLTLDVTTPATDDGRRPVIVWLHGGGGTNGSSAAYDAGRLAATGDVVVVVPQYRLGVLGCFGHPALAEGGVFGLLDQQAVLRWVRSEIERFGGDPGNVTLAGDSYGALMVAAQLTAPDSDGLFHRAILQSAFAAADTTPANLFAPGVPALPPRWVSEPELAALGAAAVREHGWSVPDHGAEQTLAALRRLPVESLLSATDQFIRPAFGGSTLPHSPATALPEGRFARVPVLLGATRDEAGFFVSLFAGLAGSPVTEDRFPLLLAEAFGDVADDVAARYPLAAFATPGEAWAKLATDRAWTLPTWQLGQALAQHTDTWCYEFADTGAPPPVPGLPGGAQHGSDLAYHFAGPALSVAQRVLADHMHGYWASFARQGDPATDGLPPWPKASTGHVQSLAPERIGGVDYVADHALDFWTQLP